MGVHFSCHGCAKPLNIKLELAGRRGVCPECGLRFRIPKADAEFSIRLEDTSVTAGHKQSAPRQKVVTAENDASESGTANAVAVAEPIVATPGQVGRQGAGRQGAGTDPIAHAIELIASDASATWYVRPPSGGQYGPANGEALKSWITEGRVAKTALLWRDGWPQWREANEALPEIADSLPGAISEGNGDVFGEGVSLSNPGASGAARDAEDLQVESQTQNPLGAINTEENVALRGTHDLGATRRKRSSRRTVMVAVLAALVIGLVVVLILVASGSFSSGSSGTG